MTQRVPVIVLVVVLVWTTTLDALLAPIGKFGYLPVTACVMVGVGTLLAARLPMAGALVAAGAITAGWAELVNLVSGDTSGPVARSTAVVAVGAAAAAVIVRRSPAAITLVMVVIAAGSGWLHARPPAAVVVVAIAVTVLGAAVIAAGGVLAAARRADPAGVAVATIVCAVAGVAIVLNPGHHSSPARSGGAVVANGRAGGGGLLVTVHRHRAASHASSWPMVVVLVAGIGLGVVVLAAALRCLVVRRSWRSSRRRLARGSGAQSAAGAWRYAVARLHAAGYRVPTGLTPDVAAVGRTELGLPVAVNDALRELGTVVTPAAFGGSRVAAAASKESWQLAQEVSATAVASVGFTARLRMLVTSPAGLG